MHKAKKNRVLAIIKHGRVQKNLFVGPEGIIGNVNLI
jgi:hypothetical protein